MELSSSEKKAFKNYILGIGKGLFTDVDFFVNYNSWRPELVIMVDVDWGMLSEKYKEHAYNYNMFLTNKFKDDVETFFKMMDIKFSAKIEFDIMNWE